MNEKPIGPRGRAYLQAAEALRKVPGDHSVLFEMLVELAVMEDSRAQGRPSPMEAAFRKAVIVEAIKLKVPPEVIKALGS